MQLMSMTKSRSMRLIQTCRMSSLSILPALDLTSITITTLTPSLICFVSTAIVTYSDSFLCVVAQA